MAIPAAGERDWFRYAAREWLRRIILGISILYWGIRATLAVTAFVVVVAASALILQSRGSDHWVAALDSVTRIVAPLSAIPLLLLFVGLWLASSHDPYKDCSWREVLGSAVSIAVIPLWLLWLAATLDVVGLYPLAVAASYVGATVMWLHIVVLNVFDGEMLRRTQGSAGAGQRPSIWIALHGVILIIVLSAFVESSYLRLVWFVWFAVLFAVIGRSRRLIATELSKRAELGLDK